MTTAILQPFARLRPRARVGILVEAAGALALAGMVFMAASFALDRTFRLESGYRFALLALLALACARIVWRRLLRPMRMRLSDDELALAVERRDPPLQEALISAVQFARRVEGAPAGAETESRQMMQFVVGQVTERARRIPFTRALDGVRPLRYGSLVALLLAATATWIALDRGSFKLWFKRNVLLSALEWPRRTQLHFVEPVLRLPQGDDLTLRVAAAGVVPEQVKLYYRFSGGERGSEAMTLTGAAEFRATLTALLEGVTLTAEGGDGLTDELRVEIVERPVITGLEVTVTPPAYTGRPTESPTGDGDIRVLRGSKLALRARSDKPTQEAFVLVGDSQRLPLSVDPDGYGLRGELTPTQTGALVVDVVDRDRLGAKAPPRLFVRVQDDQAPSVDLRLRGIGSMVTAVARIPADLVVRDDLGLTAVAALFRVTGKPLAPTSASGQAPEPAPDQPEPDATKPEQAATPEPEPKFAPVTATGLDAFAKGEPELRAEVAVDLRDLNAAQPGQMFALRFDATDNFGPDAPHVTEGEPAVFRVVVPEELAADLQRRQLEQRKLLEAVLAQHQTARAQLDETLSPTANDPRATQARQKLVQLAKTARELGARAGSIGVSYAQILDEALNNRLAQAGDLRGMRDRVVAPLGQLSTEDFPQGATATEAYAAAGKDDLKVVALATYDSITTKIQNILAQMQREERLAAVIAGLQELLKLWGTNTDEVSKRRGDAGSELFGPGRDDKDKPTPKPDGGKK